MYMVNSKKNLYKTKKSKCSKHIINRNKKIGGKTRKNIIMRGGNFTDNFKTYLDYVSPNAYIPFNTATGTSTDPLAPAVVHDARLDPQKPITPVFIGGKKGKRKSKNVKKMKGGAITDTLFGSGYSAVSNNPVIALVNSNSTQDLANLSMGKQVVIADPTVQLAATTYGTNVRTPLV